MEIVKVDERGRVIIPKSVREKVGVKEGGYVKMMVEGERIVIQPLKSVADKYFGAFKVGEWPDDLDEFVVKVMREWWSLKHT